MSGVQKVTATAVAGAREGFLRNAELMRALLSRTGDTSSQMSNEAGHLDRLLAEDGMPALFGSNPPPTLDGFSRLG